MTSFNKSDYPLYDIIIVLETPGKIDNCISKIYRIRVEANEKQLCKITDNKGNHIIFNNNNYHNIKYIRSLHDILY